MNNMKILIFLSIIYISNAMGAVPTSESLFRNGNNKNLTGNFIVLKFSIVEIPTEEEIANLKNAAGESGNADLLIREKFPHKFVKFIFSLESEDKIQLLQAIYSDSAMKNNTLVNTNYVEDINNKIMEDTEVERALFHSLLMMFSLNESSGIANVYNT